MEIEYPKIEHSHKRTFSCRPEAAGHNLKGRYLDNIFIERLWRSVKYEKIFLEEFETVTELITGLKEYFQFYNFERPHQSFKRKTPAEVYWGEKVAQKAA